MTDTSARETLAHPSTTATMRAVVQRGYGPPEQVLRLEDVPRPSVGDSDVLIQVRAASVNTPDLIAVTGDPRILRLKTGLRRPRTAIRGSDVAGVVAEVGRGVTDLQPGDAVFGSIWDNQPVQRAGTFAEYTVAPATQVIAKPPGLSFQEAAASVMTGLTALAAIRDVGAVGPGTRVLVNGASGGVGTMAIQIAHALGAEVTGVCSTGNVDLVRSLGADHVIDYSEGNYTRSDKRYDVILDNIMNHAPAATARLLTPTGVFIPNSIGTSGGAVGGLPRMAAAAILGRRRALRVGTVTCVVHQHTLIALADLLSRGGINVVIDRTYCLEDTASGVTHMLRHHARGKVAISVPPSCRRPATRAIAGLTDGGLSDGDP